MTEEEAYELLATHKMLENKEKPGEFYCGAIACPHQYTAPLSRNWQAHRRHWARLIADATGVTTCEHGHADRGSCSLWNDALCFCGGEVAA